MIMVKVHAGGTAAVGDARDRHNESECDVTTLCKRWESSEITAGFFGPPIPTMPGAIRC